MDKLKNKKIVQNLKKTKALGSAVIRQNKQENNVNKINNTIGFSSAFSNKDSVGNVVKFASTSPEVLTETEINNLFSGFVRLIKKNVIIEKEGQYKQTIAELNLKLQTTQNEVERLRQQLQR